MAKIDYQFDYENIFSNPDEEDEKYFAANGRPIHALRLYNFITDVAQIIENHKVGIYKYIFTPLKSQTDYWINLVGYASKIGDQGHNRDLSLQRCMEVQKEILTGRNKLNVAEFRRTTARGSDASKDAPDDDFGYWRSVKIYAHKGSPPPVKIEPKPIVPAFIQQKFAIKMVAGNSVSLFKMFGLDEYIFKIKNEETFETACFFYRGKSVAAGGPGSPVSITGSGPWVSFTTSSRFKLTVKDFDNLLVSLAQQPGISAGSDSVLGNFLLDFRKNHNKQFTVRETSINPSSLTISADGMGFSTALTASSGTLEMVECPKDASNPTWA